MGASCSSSTAKNDSIDISTSSYHSQPNESIKTLSPSPIRVEIVKNLEEALTINVNTENKSNSSGTPKFTQTPLHRKHPQPPQHHFNSTMIYTPPLLCTPKDDDHYRVLPGTMNKNKRPLSMDVTGVISKQSSNNRKSSISFY